MNAPGNDVFDSRDVQLESERARHAKLEFSAALTQAEEELIKNVGPEEQIKIQPHFQMINQAMGEMVK